MDAGGITTNNSNSNNSGSSGSSSNTINSGSSNGNGEGSGGGGGGAGGVGGAGTAAADAKAAKKPILPRYFGVSVVDLMSLPGTRERSLPRIIVYVTTPTTLPLIHFVLG